jgi:SAM-dependent methyltransferase
VCSQYRNAITAEYIQDQATTIRWEKTLKFINKDYSCSRGLDLGDRTPFTDKLEDVFGCPFDNTDIDLDVGFLDGSYDIVTAFEIIEHLFNPLHCLLQVHKVLKDGGRLYLSTPKGKPYFLWSKDHFHEMSYGSLEALLKRAGFEIIRQTLFRVRPMWFYFTGIRPLFRGIFEKFWLLELHPKKLMGN